MKYAVVDRGDPQSQALAARLHESAAAYGLHLDTASPDIVISIGGDGTLLQAFHYYEKIIDTTSFVGIHTGHLGFYADWQAHELDELMKLMGEQEARIASYPLAEITIEAGDETLTYLALNEFTLKGVEGTLVAQININDDLFEMFRGDGLVISTPSGSTAYNKSVGGSVVHPSVESLQLAEIASINNRVFRTLGSSVLLPQHHHCNIITQKKQRVVLAVDHQSFERDDVHSIRCKVSSRKIHFARYRYFPFWKRVREAFLGYDVQ